jgi:hypothetical protein
MLLGSDFSCCRAADVAMPRAHSIGIVTQNRGIENKSGLQERRLCRVRVACSSVPWCDGKQNGICVGVHPPLLLQQ